MGEPMQEHHRATNRGSGRSWRAANGWWCGSSFRADLAAVLWHQAPDQAVGSGHDGRQRTASEWFDPGDPGYFGIDPGTTGSKKHEQNQLLT